MSESKKVFNRNVSYGVGKSHTHYLKGHPVPSSLIEEIGKLGYSSDESEVREKPASAPLKTERKEAPGGSDSQALIDALKAQSDASLSQLKAEHSKQLEKANAERDEALEAATKKK